MSVDGFLTLLSLLIAVYALLPRHRRLEIWLTCTFFHFLVLAPAVLLIFYLHFFDVFASIGWTPGLGLKKNGLSPDRAAYIIAILTSIFFVLVSRFRKLNRRTIFRFRNLIDELITNQAWAGLFSLMKLRLKEVADFYESDVIWARLRSVVLSSAPSRFDHLPSSQLLDILSRSERGESVEIPKPPFWSQVRIWGHCLLAPIRFIAKMVLPGSSPARLCAKDIIQEFLLSRKVVDALVEIDPYFALDFFRFKFSENIDFADLYLRLQIVDPKSSLFKEILRNLNSSSRNRYEFPERNRILLVLVRDVKRAVQFQVWRPIGEAALEFLNSLRRDKADPYSEEPFNYDEQKDSCPIQASIWFFDIMVSEAFFQNEQWHMWLYYMTHYTRAMIRNLPNSSEAEERYATRYHHLIEDIVWRLRNWVGLIEDAEVNQANAVLNKINADHENGNIPKSAILCLGAVLEEILLTPKLSNDFKDEQVHTAFSLYFRLKFEFNRSDYATVLLQSMKTGGSMFADETKVRSMKVEYARAWGSFDKIPHTGHDDFDKEIQSILL